MTLGNDIYNKVQCDEKYNIYIEALKHDEHPKSIINIIDELHDKRTTPLPQKEHFEQLDKVQIGNKETSYESLKITKHLCDYYENHNLNHIFIITIYFRHNTICKYLNETNHYEYKLHHYIKFFNIVPMIKEEVDYHYGMLLLDKTKYIEASKYIYNINPVNVDQLNIQPTNMNFFKENDSNKTLLIYMSGGIGDNIMYGRFINKVLDLYSSNKIIFLVYDSLFWIYDFLHQNDNITIVPYKNRDNIKHFDYHCNVFMLFSYLKLDYKDIYFEPYPKQLPFDIMDFDHILCKNKKNIIINWKGGKQNTHEEYNRKIPIHYLKKVFQMKNVNFICITKDIDDEERLFLNDYNVHYVGSIIDKNDAFRCSGYLMKQVNMVVTSDTSLAHMAGTLDVNVVTLLTCGCEWRWTHNKTTNWYPKMKLLRQTKPFEWDNVIKQLITTINNQ